jgi:Tfp pilus assembly protein PilN
MSAKTTMCILFGDKTVDAVFVEHSMLGTQIKFMKRLPRDEQVFSAVAELMKSEPKTPARVMLCIPRSSAIQRTLSYPIAAKTELENMIRFEATRHIPLPEDNRLLGWSTADTPDEKQVLLNLIAASQSEVRELINQLEQAGVPVDEAVPFSSAVSPVLADVPTLLLLVDEHIELCLYGMGILQDSQLISCTAAGFSSERVVTSTRQMVAKHKSWLGDEGISRIYTGGAGQMIDGLREELEAVFGLHVHPLELSGTMDSILTEEQESFIEVVMAASIDLDPTLNLIEDKKRKVPISRRTLIISGLCILLSIEVLAFYGFKSGAPWLQRKKVAQELREMQRATADIQEMRNQNRIYRKQLVQLEQVCESRVSIMDMLKAISDALPEDSYLNGFSFEGGQLTLKGNSKEPGQLPELVLALPFVNALNTSDIGRKEGDYYEFELSVSLRR